MAAWSGSSALAKMLPGATPSTGNRSTNDSALVPADAPIPQANDMAAQMAAQMQAQMASTLASANTGDPTGYNPGQASITKVGDTPTGRQLLYGNYDMSTLGNNRPDFQFPSTAIEDPASIPNIDITGLSNQAQSFISSIEPDIPDFMPVYDKVKQERMGRLNDDLQALGINAARQKQNITDMRAGPTPQYGTPGTAIGDLSAQQGEMFKKAYDFALNNVDTQAAGAEVHLRDVMNQTLDKAMGDVAHTYFQGSVDQALAHPGLVLQALNNYTDAAKSDQQTALGQNQIIGENRRTSATLSTDQAKTIYGEQGMDARASQNIAAQFGLKGLDIESDAAKADALAANQGSQFNVGLSADALKFKASADNARSDMVKAAAINDTAAYRDASLRAQQNDQLYKQELYKNFINYGYDTQKAATLAGVNAQAASTLAGTEADAATTSYNRDMAKLDTQFKNGQITAGQLLVGQQNLASQKALATTADIRLKSQLAPPNSQQSKTITENTQSLNRAFNKLGVSESVMPNPAVGPPSPDEMRTKINVPAMNLTDAQKQLYLTGKKPVDDQFVALTADPTSTLVTLAGAVAAGRMTRATADDIAWDMATSQAISSKRTTVDQTNSSQKNKLDAQGNVMKNPITGETLKTGTTDVDTTSAADVTKIALDYRGQLDDLMGLNQDAATQQFLREKLVGAINAGMTPVPKSASSMTR